MKILYVIHSLTIGGAETIAANYLIQLKKAGQDVVLLQMFDKETFLNKRLSEEGIRVETACDGKKNGFLSKVNMIRNMRQLIKKENPDIIHVHTGLEKFRYIKYPAARIVFTIHSEWDRCIGQGKNHREMLFRLIKKGMSVIVLRDKTKFDVLQQFPDAKVYEIPNGIDLDAIRNHRYDRKEFLQSLHIPETDFILGHVGRFHQVKNHEKIITVFCKLLEKRKDAQLLLVGSGNEEEEGRVRRLVEESGVSGQIHLLGDRKDAAAVMSVMDCFILPSYSEGFSLVLVEAQALGIRCVVSEKVAPEVCCNENCLQLPLEEADEKWVDCILGDWGEKKQKSLSQYRISEVIGQHLALYESLIRQPKHE